MLMVMDGEDDFESDSFYIVFFSLVIQAIAVKKPRILVGFLKDVEGITRGVSGTRKARILER